MQLSPSNKQVRVGLLHTLKRGIEIFQNARLHASVGELGERAEEQVGALFSDQACYEKTA